MRRAARPLQASFLLERSLGWSDGDEDDDADGGDGVPQKGTSVDTFITWSRICVRVFLSTFPHMAGVPQKGISCERTFRATSGAADLRGMLSDICESLAEAMEEKGVAGRKVTLKFKTADFDLFTRDASSARRLTAAAQIEALAAPLLEREQATPY